MTADKAEIIERFVAGHGLMQVVAPFCKERLDNERAWPAVAFEASNLQASALGIIRDELIRLRAENASLRKIEAKVREILNRAPYEGGVHYYEGATDAATEILAAGSVDE